MTTDKIYKMKEPLLGTSNQKSALVPRDYCQQSALSRDYCYITIGERLPLSTFMDEQEPSLGDSLSTFMDEQEPFLGDSLSTFMDKQESSLGDWMQFMERREPS